MKQPADFLMASQCNGALDWRDKQSGLRAQICWIAAPKSAARNDESGLPIILFEEIRQAAQFA